MDACARLLVSLLLLQLRPGGFALISSGHHCVIWGVAAAVVIVVVVVVLVVVECGESSRKREKRKKEANGKSNAWQLSCLVNGSLAATEWIGRGCGNVTCCCKREGT